MPTAAWQFLRAKLVRGGWTVYRPFSSKRSGQAQDAPPTSPADMGAAPATAEVASTQPPTGGHPAASAAVLLGSPAVCGAKATGKRSCRTTAPAPEDVSGNSSPGMRADAACLDRCRLEFAVEEYLCRSAPQRLEDLSSKAIQSQVPTCSSGMEVSTVATLEDLQDESPPCHSRTKVSNADASEILDGRLSSSPSTRSSWSSAKCSSASSGTSCSFSSEPARRRAEATWWDEADLQAIRSIQKPKSLTRLTDVKVFKHSAESQSPWDTPAASQLHSDMGMWDASTPYIATWLRIFDDTSLVFAAGVEDRELLESCLTEDFMTRRLRFLANPVHLPTPLPLKTSGGVGAFFGRRNASFSCARSDDGRLLRLDLQVNLCANWLVRAALRGVALRLGNILELVLMDGPSGVVIGSSRLQVTEELLCLLA
uniref:Uncharacterized protein n=1 Tax=Alexandrium monilatum TaxID=311494 RepID=A0A7S4PSB5_9DINO